MNAVLTFVIVLSCAAALGWLVYRWFSGIRSRVLRVVLSIAPAFLVLIGAWIAFVARGIQLPAADDSIFSDRSTLTLQFEGSTGVPLKLGINYPKAVKINEDAYAEAELSFPAALATSSLSATLGSGNEVVARAVQACDDPAAPSTVSEAARRTKACSGGAGAEERFRWIVRSDKAGVSFATITFPPAVAQSLNAPGAQWRAKIQENGRDVEVFVHGDGRPWEIGESRVDTKIIALTLDPQKKTFKGNEADLDLGSGQVIFPLRFDTTLGVSGETYDLLAKIGALLSAVLGTGWLWQVLSWRKDRKKEETANGGDARKHPTADGEALASDRTQAGRAEK